MDGGVRAPTGGHVKVLHHGIRRGDRVGCALGFTVGLFGEPARSVRQTPVPPFGGHPGAPAEGGVSRHLQGGGQQGLPWVLPVLHTGRWLFTAT